MKDIRIAGFTAVIVLALGTGPAWAQKADFKIDPSHSEADFAIKHMAISTVHGTFRGVSGVISFDPADLTKSGVEATIDVATVDTGVANRDAHLKTPDFFDVAKFPTMTFKSTKVAKTGDGYAVTGDLLLHGVTKSVVLSLEPPDKPQTDGKGNVHRGFTARTTINRKDFGLLWANKTGTGDAVLGDDIKIELDIEAIKI
jgi:polyisoprenoid-binding protein YceI